jgi:glycopeptide antibiotics resistance protein
MGIVQVFDLLLILFFGLVWTGIALYFYFSKKKSLTYLLFFSLFFIYLYKVLDYTLFQFQSLLILKHFMPNLMLRGQEAGKTINLIPLMTLTAQDLSTSLLNILLFVPFGFLFPIVSKFRMKKTIIIGVLFSITIELLQLVTGILEKVTFRIADVNDVIFNTLGAVIGYTLFIGFVRVARKGVSNRGSV